LSQEDYSTQLNGIDNFNGRSAHHKNLEGLRQPELVMAAAKQKRSQLMPEAQPQFSKRRLDASNSIDNAIATGTASLASTSLTATTTTVPTPTPASSSTEPTTNPKFRAFGEFVSHSLTELPFLVSMRLLETITRDLVQAAIDSAKHSKQTKPGSADHSSMDEADD